MFIPNQVSHVRCRVSHIMSRVIYLFCNNTHTRNHHYKCLFLRFLKATAFSPGVRSSVLPLLVPTVDTLPAILHHDHRARGTSSTSSILSIYICMAQATGLSTQLCFQVLGPPYFLFLPLQLTHCLQSSTTATGAGGTSSTSSISSIYICMASSRS